MTKLLANIFATSSSIGQGPKAIAENAGVTHAQARHCLRRLAKSSTLIKRVIMNDIVAYSTT